MRRWFGAGLIAVAAGAALVASRPIPLKAAGDYGALTAIHLEFQAIRRPTIAAGVPDYSTAGLAARRGTFGRLRARLDAIDPHSWPVPQQVDRFSRQSTT
jgi:hypothetical protein